MLERSLTQDGTVERNVYLPIIGSVSVAQINTMW